MNVSEIIVGENIEIITAGDMDVLAVVSPKVESLEPEIPTDEELEEGAIAEEGATDDEETSDETEAKEESSE
jgi:hypothetical protein